MIGDSCEGQPLQRPTAVKAGSYEGRQRYRSAAVQIGGREEQQPRQVGVSVAGHRKKRPAPPEVTRAARCSPDRIRTGATALRGRRPRPLDDGARTCFSCFAALSSGAAELYQRPATDVLAGPSVAGVPGLEPRLTEPESVGLPITPYPSGALSNTGKNFTGPGGRRPNRAGNTGLTWKNAPTMVSSAGPPDSTNCRCSRCAP